MVIVKYLQLYFLYGQPVRAGSFTLIAGDGLKKYCCAVCLRIYQLLNEYNSTPSYNKHNKIYEDI